MAIVYALISYIVFPLKYWDIIEPMAQNSEVSPFLITAIIKAESNFNPTAISPKGAKGLMQLMDDTAYWSAGKMDFPYQSEGVYTPEVNISIGTWYFAEYLLPRYNGDVTLALAAYNAGHGNVDKWEFGIIEYPETQQYVKKVKLYYKLYQIFHPWRLTNVLSKR